MVDKIQLIEPNSTHTFNVTDEQEGQRLDVFIASQFPSYSRSFFEKLIKQKNITINDKPIHRKSTPVMANDTISITFPDTKKDPVEIKKNVESLHVQIAHEHPHFLVINKPAKLLVHAPHAESEAITLVDWLIAKFDDIRSIGSDDRPGIVHRLDKDTTGLIIIPRNNCAHAYFSDLFKNRKIQKTYLAIVKGHPDKEGEIDLEIARNPYDRNKMTHVTGKNVSKIKSKIRQAKTFYKIIEYFDEYSLVEAKPVTGRTHQIRVHFAGIGHPLLGDPVYGEKSKIISRHALHAQKLEFEFEGEKFCIIQNAPQDFKKAIKFLQQNKS